MRVECPCRRRPEAPLARGAVATTTNYRVFGRRTRGLRQFAFGGLTTLVRQIEQDQAWRVAADGVPQGGTTFARRVGPVRQAARPVAGA
jgi:hypothetical protein